MTDLSLLATVRWQLADNATEDHLQGNTLLTFDIILNTVPPADW
jgi:hypothetical protein